MTTIPSNVWEFIDRARADVGRIEATYFGQDMHAQIVERQIESPIEQLFLVAMHVMCRANFEEINPEPHPGVTPGSWIFPRGVQISPQVPVGSYRVDFVVSVTGLPTGAPSLIVELDGHEFHDKDKRQRSYEKRRDRDLVRAGYRVLHFTGSDVVKDPYAVAHEVLAASGIDLEPYNPANPFGVD